MGCAISHKLYEWKECHLFGHNISKWKTMKILRIENVFYAYDSEVCITPCFIDAIGLGY